jgi:hypothetical protein
MTRVTSSPFFTVISFGSNLNLLAEMVMVLEDSACPEKLAKKRNMTDRVSVAGIDFTIIELSFP